MERILAYKLDLLTTDDVCLEFIVGDESYVADEEMNGWSELTGEMNQRFLILSSWLENILQPPFATNFAILWDRQIQETVLALSSERVDQLWRLSQRDFQSDGSLRDIYVRGTNQTDWNAVLAVVRGMFAPVRVTTGEGSAMNHLSPNHFNGKQRVQVTFNIGDVEIIGHYFEASAIELSLDPKSVITSAVLGELLRFAVSVARFVGRTVVITPENAPDLPIFMVQPTGHVEFLAPQSAV